MVAFLRLLLLQLLLALLLLCRATTEIEGLNVEVEWVIQGREMSFSGFMVEFLGFTSAFFTKLPQLHVSKGLYTHSFDESPFKEGFLSELFPEEARRLQHFVSPKHHPLPATSPYAPPTPRFMQTEELLSQKSVLCDDSSSSQSSGSVIRRGKEIQGGELSRYLYEQAYTEKDCCLACLHQPLCLAWSMNMESKSCRFRGSSHKPLQILDVNVDASPHDQFSDSISSGSFARSAELPLGRIPVPRVMVYHGTNCVYNNDTAKNLADPNVVSIGRYMIERSDFSEGVGMNEFTFLRCAASLNEIWVPTKWCKETFIKLMQSIGFPSPQVTVIPEAVETTLFDPAVYDPEGCNCLHISDICSGAWNDRIDKRFNLLSIFKWEDRKGWDVLLDSYWNAFSLSDNVHLNMRTYIPKFDMKFPNSAEMHAELDKRITAFTKNRFNKTLEELPLVEHRMSSSIEVDVDGFSPEDLFAGEYDRELTREEIRDLLHSADAFILPTRGEGWGLPIAEAMAMAMDVVTSDVPGPSAYATNENAYLIPKVSTIRLDGHQEINNTAAAEILRSLYHEHLRRFEYGKNDESSANTESNNICCSKCKRYSAKGKAARKTMQKISPEYCVDKMVKRIREIVAERGLII